MIPAGFDTCGPPERRIKVALEIVETVRELHMRTSDMCVYVGKYLLLFQIIEI